MPFLTRAGAVSKMIGMRTRRVSIPVNRVYNRSSVIASWCRKYTRLSSRTGSRCPLDCRPSPPASGHAEIVIHIPPPVADVYDDHPTLPPHPIFPPSPSDTVSLTLFTDSHSPDKGWLSHRLPHSCGSRYEIQYRRSYPRLTNYSNAFVVPQRVSSSLSNASSRLLSSNNFYASQPAVANSS
ncbi:hypothetical protein BDN71DRAFT_1511586 [Pleurotus eryngii]|uniref:Uncharacterized protein n=1 Tax=Pleurotus eryngii TaxID=5323 RepID=A0A9P6DAV8_PLEER|nr:hypothetical protein BDN71DRAFT_1511586 [Pleurotus eryngii]